MPSPVRKVAQILCLSCKHTLTSGQYSFSRVLNPNWSIQITGSPAVRKSIEYGYALGTLDLRSFFDTFAYKNQAACISDFDFDFCTDFYF